MERCHGFCRDFLLVVAWSRMHAPKEHRLALWPLPNCSHSKDVSFAFLNVVLLVFSPYSKASLSFLFDERLLDDLMTFVLQQPRLLI